MSHDTGRICPCQKNHRPIRRASQSLRLRARIEGLRPLVTRNARHMRAHSTPQTACEHVCDDARRQVTQVHTENLQGSQIAFLEESSR